MDDAIMQTESNRHTEEEMARVLKETSVLHLVASKRRLVEVPYTASVGDTLHTMLAHNIVAVPVAAPPGHWIGAGGSMIVESDRATGVARKQYIGIVSAMDVLFHLADLKDGVASDVPSLLAGTRVSTIIGRCVEGLSLWAITPDTSVLDAMDPMSKGLHRVLVPLGSQAEHINVLTSGSTSPLESEECAPCYRMFTQTDVVQFLLFKLGSLEPILGQRVDGLRVIQEHVFGVSAEMTLADTIKCMTQAALNAVAILDPPTCKGIVNVAGLMSQDGGGPQLVPATGKRLVATFSASDLRGCSVESFQDCARESVLLFLRRANVIKKFGGVGGAMLGAYQQAAAAVGNSTETDMPLVTCHPSSTLASVIRSALEWRVHRVWVVDEQEQAHGPLILRGMISLSDILRAVRDRVIATGDLSNGSSRIPHGASRAAG